MNRIKTKKLLVFALMLLASIQGARADKQSDTLEVKFRVGQSDIDLSYADNERRIADFTRRVKERYAKVPQGLITLDIYTGASPEGPTELNKRLGEQRGISLRDLLKKELGNIIPGYTIVNKGARWGELYQMVEQSDEEWRNDVLRILSKEPGQDNWKMDPREAQLRRLKGGSVWREIDQRYLPVLRMSGSAIIAELPDVQRDTLVILQKDTIIYLPEPCPEPIIDHRPFWALKTNLLLWGVGAPNVQLEIPLGTKNRWSIEGEFFCPWWTWSHNAHAEQFLDLGLEARYWLGNRQRHHTLDGWHIGLALAAGYYDFEWQRSEGYQGEYLDAYVNFGWQKRISTHWAFDAGVGLGWIGTKYRHYLGSSVFPVGHEEKYDDHLMWQNNARLNVFGLTHANVTVAYMFDARKKANRTRLENVNLEELSVRNHEAKLQERANRELAKGEAAQAKARERAAKDEAKARQKAEEVEAKAAKEAQEAEAKAAKAAQKAQKAQESQSAQLTEANDKAAAAEAKAREKAEAKAAKEAQEAEAKAAKEAAAAAKAAKAAEEKAAKEAAAAAKAAEAQAAKEAKEAAKKASKTVKDAQDAADEKAAAAEAKAAAAEAKAREKAEAKAAKEEAKARAKAAKAEQKAAEEEAKAKAKQDAAEAKMLEKAASAEAKAAKAEAKARAKQEAAEAKAMAKAEAKLNK